MIFQPAHYRGSYEPSDPFHFTLHHNRFALTLLPATSSPKYMLDGRQSFAHAHVGRLWEGWIKKVQPRLSYCSPLSGEWVGRIYREKRQGSIATTMTPPMIALISKLTCDLRGNRKLPAIWGTRLPIKDQIRDLLNSHGGCGFLSCHSPTFFAFASCSANS